MEKIKVSLIVPIYKVEKYLRRAMDSLVNQTLANEVEIICINDGSPDNSLKIIKEYKEKYQNRNIIIIDKKNEGVWKGRKDGINIATGEYIGFVDPDDYIALDYAEKLYNVAIKNNADISVCGFYRVDVETEYVYGAEMNKYGKKVIKMSKNPEDILSINPALWNKLYKADILKNMKNLSNPPTILDDMMFLLLIYLNTEKIVFIEDILYFYMIRKDSIISTIKKEKIISTEKAMCEVKKIYQENTKNDKSIKVLDVMAFLHFGLSLMFRISYDKNCKLKDELNLNKKYLDDNFSSWRKSEFLKLSYCIKKHSNIKVAIMKKVYVLNLYSAFLTLYRFMIDKLKIDIKW